MHFVTPASRNVVRAGVCENAYSWFVATTLRVSNDVRDRASQLASADGISIGDLVAKALDAYERDLFWAQTREALREGPSPVEDDWARTIRDGLADE